MKADIAVVGTGLTALVAARTVLEAGRTPLLVSPGLSSLYFVFATIDVLGYRDHRSHDPVDNPERAVAELIAADPRHPYALAGSEALRSGMALFVEWLRVAGLRWQGSLDRNYLLPTAIGAVKPACLVPDSMAAGDLRSESPIVLCSFTGYEDFMPELAAANLSEHGGHQVAGLRISLPMLQPGRLHSSVDLARAFEDGAFQDQVVERIRQTAMPSNARVGLPAVLGMTDVSVYEQLQRKLGRPIFEVPTLPPSIPGLRLFDRLRRDLQRDGVEILASPAYRAEIDHGRCARITVKSAGREEAIEASAFVLALEDAVDGAWRAGPHTVRDPFFNRTLDTVRSPVDRASESLFNPQPFARVGYAVSRRLQPLDDVGKPLAANVFVAGGAIRGYDPVGTRSRGGLAIATGYRAAREALQG